jgi:MotA/TolQ/ExbB proton channel family
VDTASIDSRPSLFLATRAESRDFLPFLRWLIVMCLTAIGVGVLWQLGLIRLMFETDRTRISSVILALFALTSLHCLTQTCIVSREMIAVRRFRYRMLRGGLALARLSDEHQGGPGETSLIAHHVGNLIAKGKAQKGRRIDQTLLLRALADRIRGREKLGLFVSEALLRLALLGTAVGFILMLIPIAGLLAFDAESLRKALAGMSGGMATALNITVTGIATALVLKLQYFFLDKALVDLLDSITEVTEVHVISALEGQADG